MEDWNEFKTANSNLFLLWYKIKYQLRWYTVINYQYGNSPAVRKIRSYLFVHGRSVENEGSAVENKHQYFRNKRDISRWIMQSRSISESTDVASVSILKISCLLSFYGAGLEDKSAKKPQTLSHNACSLQFSKSLSNEDSEWIQVKRIKNLYASLDMVT